MSAALSAIAGRPPGQIGIVVYDLEAALERYSRLWGLSPWRCWTYGPETVPDLGLRGERAGYEIDIALWGQHPQIELIEPVRGPSIYHEWLEEHGEGLHHIGIYVPDLGAGLDQMARGGHEPVQWGRGYGKHGDGGFAYFDMRALFGIYVELIEIPTVRMPPRRVYPGDAG
ncbi:MAG: VOC family protein [Thermoleophilaceae bacterium]|nr:VOC family protein [Thermoleophilaceae bacterium]